MKYFFLLYLLFVSISLNAQEQYLFIPEIDSLSAYQYKDNKLRKLTTTKFEITKLFHIEKKHFVITNSDSSGILFGTFEMNGINIFFKKKLPSNFHPISIFLFNGFIFVGGNWNSGDFFLVLDTNTKEWAEIKIPEEVYFPGKGIDDFLMMDSTLIAVDNIVYPKFLLFYDVKNLLDLNLIKTFELDDNGAYESIHKGINSENYIGLLSSSGGCCSSYDNIQILKSDRLEDGFTISKKNRITYRSEWNDIEIIENKVYLATNKGLGIFQIKSRYFKNSDRNYRLHKNRSINKRKIRYKLFSPKNIIQLIKLYDDELILIYKDKENKYQFKFN